MADEELARSWLEEEIGGPDIVLAGEHVDSLIELLSRVCAEERERCARVCESIRERIIHTEHVDGIGMGNQRKELGCVECAAAIREGG